jgi:hypothetical protein
MVMRNIKKRLLGEVGQSLVEFALVTLFVILPVTFGIIDGGILFYKWVTLNNGAREGARAGAIYRYAGDAPSGSRITMEEVIDPEREGVITQAVQATIAPLVTLDDWGVTYPDDPCIDLGGDGEFCMVYRSGDRVTVAITHTHAPLVGLVIGLDGIDLAASATMRIEPGGAGPTPTPP